MMTPEQIQALFVYDSWAHELTLDACAALTPEEFTRDLASSFRSIRDTLVHISGAQWIWLERINGRSPAALPAPDTCSDLMAVRAHWNEVHGNLLAFINGASATDLERVLEYRNPRGQYRTPIWQILMQLVNHGSYHRGQVTTMLRQLGATPVSTDLIGFYRQQAGQPL
ncbi:MAG TPA: DinB family protein [Candidatus Acidoferrales bacterium]|jgi:uncharacterized damage-inducible protein DinB